MSSADAARYFAAYDRAVDSQPTAVRILTEAAGFEVSNTGGGCLTYENNHGKIIVRITANDGVSLPAKLDSRCLYGAYGPNGDWMNTDDEIEMTAADFVSVWRTLAEQAAKYFAEGFQQDVVPVTPWLTAAEGSGCIHPEEFEAVERVLSKISQFAPKPT